MEDEKSHELELMPLTQLCGVNLPRKNFIITSLRKYFSAERYGEHEKKLIQNIRLEGEAVGRKYFKTLYFRERMDFIQGIKLGKTSLMMQYLSESIQDLQYQKYLENISGQLQKLFLTLNRELFSSVGNLELRYEEKDLLTMVQSTEICGCDELPIEMKDTWELIQLYFSVLLEIKAKLPEMTLVILENIDHMLCEEEYIRLCVWLEQIGKQHNLWFLLSTSIPGYTYISEESFPGINIINDLIYGMPEMEKMVVFLKENYPCTFSEEEWQEKLKAVIHYIGKEGVALYPQSMVLLKLVNSSMCVKTKGEFRLNQVENRFLLG